MNLEKTIITTYQYFFSKILKNSSYVFIPKKSELTLIESLIFFLSDSKNRNLITEDLIFIYFSFQFEYWSTKKTIYGNGKILFNWVVGKKAFERYSQTSINKRYYSEKYCRENKLNKSEIFSVINFDKDKKRNVDNLTFIENLERKRFLNTKIGLQNCVFFTSLFKEENITCIKCNSSIRCRIILNNRINAN